MSRIVNRRNAVLGWATWSVISQLLKKNAKGDTAAAKKKKQAEKQKRKEQVSRDAARGGQGRSNRRVIAFLVAAGVGVGAWLKSRGGGRKDGVE